MRRVSARAIVATLLAVVVGLAALTHSHAHSFVNRGSGAPCVFCEHGAAPAPAAPALVLLPLCRTPAETPPAVMVARMVADDHLARGPPVVVNPA